MSEHLSQTQLTGYSGRTLAADELLVVDRHLASCNECYARFTSILAEIRNQAPPSHVPSSDSIEEPFHLDYDQHLVAYVDGTANDIDREIVESHIALCTKCAEDLEDLQDFRQQPVSTRAVKPLRRWDRMVQWQWPPLLNPQLRLAIVVVLLLGITAAVMIWTTQRSRRPVEQAGNPAVPEVDKKKEALPSGPEGNNSDKAATQPSPQREEDRRDGPKPPEEPLIALNDGGGQITVDQNGHVAGLQSLPPELTKSVEAVLATRQFPVTKTLTDLSPGSGSLRGGGAETNTLTPLGPTGIVIESDQPTFRWRALAGGSNYVVTIYDSRLRSVQNSGPLEGTEWTTRTPLERGVIYSWQITAVKDGKTVVSPRPPLPEARFKVLDRKGVSALQDAKRLYGHSHLAMGVLYWKHGLFDEAERELEALARANPNAHVAAQLLANVKSIRRR